MFTLGLYPELLTSCSKPSSNLNLLWAFMHTQSIQLNFIVEAGKKGSATQEKATQYSYKMEFSLWLLIMFSLSFLVTMVIGSTLVVNRNIRSSKCVC